MEISDKDVYQHIVNFAVDRDVVSMLAVNRKFTDDMHFRKILEKRYPLLLEFKENETYKQFYLEMIMYISRLWEKYQVPYVHSLDYNPEYFYKKFANNIYSTILLESAEIGDIELAKYLINKGAQINNFTYISTIIGDNVNMMKFLVENYSPKESWLEEAYSFARKPDIINYLDDLLKK